MLWVYFLRKLNVFFSYVIPASIEDEFRHITAFKLQTRLCTKNENILNAGRYNVIIKSCYYIVVIHFHTSLYI